MAMRPMAAAMKAGCRIVPLGRPISPASVVRGISDSGMPRKLRPSTPPVRHCSSTTTSSTAATAPRPPSTAQTCCTVRTRMAT